MSSFSEITTGLVKARLEIGEEELFDGWKYEKQIKGIWKKKVDCRKRESEEKGENGTVVTKVSNLK